MYTNFFRDFDLSETGIDEGVIAGLISMVAIYAAIIAFICLSLYILRALGVYKMSKTAGISSPWVAFVPIANSPIGSVS